MTPERWQQIRGVFDEAVAIRTEERAAYLDKACASDAELRHEVESLLSSDDRAGTKFLNTPAVDFSKAALSDAPNRVGRRIGAYNTLEEIGRGGMGEVYRAGRADGQYEKEVAIKLVRGGYDTASVLERFRHERQILASLDHPNIARLLDGGTTDEGIPYLVMELIEGTPIDQYCDAHKFECDRTTATVFASLRGGAVCAPAAGHPSGYQAGKYSGDEGRRAEVVGFWDRENSRSGSEFRNTRSRAR